ncbi:MAG: DUF6922 domain-containing protein [Nitrospirota bacterium]
METLRKKSLFWDTDPEGLSSESHWFFIIERILEFGDWEKSPNKGRS